MRDADCTPGREPRSVAASTYEKEVISSLQCGSRTTDGIFGLKHKIIHHDFGVYCGMYQYRSTLLVTGSIANSAKVRYISFAEGDFEVFRPAGSQVLVVQCKWSLAVTSKARTVRLKYCRYTYISLSPSLPSFLPPSLPYSLLPPSLFSNLPTSFPTSPSLPPFLPVYVYPSLPPYS